MYRIYMVEDDNTISELLSNHLTGWGYAVKTAKDFNNILREFSEFLPHVILMDISLPFFNGYYWCQEIRKVSKVPIIFVSSTSDKMNIIMAMDKGADDFITKPFDVNLLIAKIQALLRRTYEFDLPSDLIEHKGVALSIKEMLVIHGDDKIPLTKNEFRILQVLMENKNAAVSRDDIMVKLWESESFIDDNTLTVNINRLRKKLAEIGLTDFIKTKKGIGYMVD